MGPSNFPPATHNLGIRICDKLPALWRTDRRYSMARFFYERQQVKLDIANCNPAKLER